MLTFRKGGEVLLVHRPKYDDLAFPKGKLDRGEHPTAAAVREVAEETGLRVRLNRPLIKQRYRIGSGRMKTVHYWTGRVIGSDDVAIYEPNAEIDEVAWVPFDKAMRLLTYDIDRATLAEALEVRKKTQTLIVLRHEESRARNRWTKDDRLRPLLAIGARQAERLTPILGAYGVDRVLSSSSIRCVQTVAPYAESIKVAVERMDSLSEEDARPKAVARIVTDVVASGLNTVICTHRPVFPALFAPLDLGDPGLAKGEMMVVHLRRGEVVATERH